MSDTAKPKPLWWRVGKGKWHEDPLTSGTPPVTMPVSQIKFVLDRRWPLWSICDCAYAVLVAADLDDKIKLAGMEADEATKFIKGFGCITRKVVIRRTAPPVADQCNWCRAAKARARKEKPL